MAKGSTAKVARRFARPQAFLAGLDATTVASLLGASADLVLLIDEKGIVRDIAHGSSDIEQSLTQAWPGQHWRDTVTVESRSKVDEMLQLAADGYSDSKPRQINHSVTGETDLPLECVIVALPARGASRKGRPAVVFGRDLRGPAALQQRLVSAQASMERDYWQLRHVENRHRLLFQTASDALLLIDADNGKLQDANAAARRLFGDAIDRSSWRLANSLDGSSRAALQNMLAQLQAAGKADTQRVRLASGGGVVELQGHLIRQAGSAQLVMRLQPVAGAAQALDPRREHLARLAELSPDACVLASAEGAVLATNRAFLDLLQLPSDESARGQSLGRWFERGGLDLNVLLSNLRQRGEVRLYATRMRTEFGTGIDVEISAAASGEDSPAVGFVIRDIGRRLVTDGQGLRELPRSADQMTELVGRVPLREIVRETTDLIEQLCIEAALELTNDNRASAAEMLGLSRQSLYVKLRRFGIADGAE